MVEKDGKNKLGQRLKNYEHKIADWAGRDCSESSSAFCFWRGFLEDFGRQKLSRQASSLAFFMIFSLFPLCLMLASVISRFSASLEIGLLSKELQNLLPQSVMNVLGAIFQNIEKSDSLSFGLIGFLSLVWAASKGINVLMASLYDIYERVKGRSTMFIRRLLALVIILILVSSVVFLLLLLSFGKYALELLTEFLELQHSLILIESLSYLFGLLYLSLLFASLYYSSSGKAGRFRQAFFVGAIASILWLLSSQGFGLFLASQTRYSFVLGSLTGILALMLWLYLCALILLSGAIFHKQLILQSRKQQKLIDSISSSN
ncbi:MAG: YihY/virulence factor BrkB family protein [Eubacteriales bacterium]|nr:YihY/virulence factor BrkB family protein [Eubacteriales bacterium]